MSRRGTGSPRGRGPEGAVAPTPPEETPERIAPSLLVGMFLAASLSPLGSTMIAVALPSIGTELGVESGPLTQWLVSSYLIVGIAAMSPGGKLGDRIGHCTALILGMAIYGAGSIVGFAVATLPTLALARVSMAAGGAMTVPATLALLRNAVPPTQRPRTFGYFGSVMGTAAAIGPLLGGELTAVFGWRSVFIANIPVIVLAYLLIRRATREAGAAEVPPTLAPAPIPEASLPPPLSAGTRRPRFDVLGSVLLGGALTLLVVAAQSSGPAVPAEVLLGCFALAIFVWWERRVEEPVLDPSLFVRPAFVSSAGVVGLHNLAMYALLFQLPIFFERVRGVEAGITGRTLIAMMIAMIVFSPIGGRVSEVVGARATAFVGTLVSLGGIYLISDFGSLAAPGDIFVALILVGSGLGLASAPSQAAAMSAVTRDDAGMAGGAISTARYVGGIIGISALGYLLAGGGAEAGSAGQPAGAEAHGDAALVYAAALIVAALCSLALPGRPRRPERSRSS